MKRLGYRRLFVCCGIAVFVLPGKDEEGSDPVCKGVVPFKSKFKSGGLLSLFITVIYLKHPEEAPSNAGQLVSKFLLR